MPFSVAQQDELFQLELQSKKLDVQLKMQELANNQAYHHARINALAIPTLTRPSGNNDHLDTGEFPLEVKKIALFHLGLPRWAIIAIYENKFNPLDLHKLRRHMEMEREDESSRSFDNFGSVSKIWSIEFLNYTQILLLFNNATHFLLLEALLAFHARIIELSDIYNWKDAVLPLAVNFHNQITYNNPLDSSAWAIPQRWVEYYCTPNKTLFITPSSLPARSRKIPATTTPSDSDADGENTGSS